MTFSHLARTKLHFDAFALTYIDTFIDSYAGDGRPDIVPALGLVHGYQKHDDRGNLIDLCDLFPQFRVVGVHAYQITGDFTRLDRTNGAIFIYPHVESQYTGLIITAVSYKANIKNDWSSEVLTIKDSSSLVDRFVT